MLMRSVILTFGKFILCEDKSLRANFLHKMLLKKPGLIFPINFRLKSIDLDTLIAVSRGREIGICMQTLTHP